MVLNDIKNGFGVVTVMNIEAAKVDEIAKSSASISEYFKTATIDSLIEAVKGATNKVSIDTLKIANLNAEGPTKTITGGQYSNPLIKYGKTMRCEMQDALGDIKVLDMLGGATLIESTDKAIKGLKFTDEFSGPVILIGETFIIDRTSGEQVDVNIVIPQFLPDSIFNLVQDAEGDATVFDLNGDVLLTNLSDGKCFYAIVDKKEEGTVQTTEVTETA